MFQPLVNDRMNLTIELHQVTPLWIHIKISFANVFDGDYLSYSKSLIHDKLVQLAGF